MVQIVRACLDRESHEKHVNVLWGGWVGDRGGGGGEWKGGVVFTGADRESFPRQRKSRNVCERVVGGG